MSDVRQLLADAASAEARGDLDGAVQALSLAAQLYRDSNNLLRAEKMERHIERLQSGQQLPKQTLEERSPSLADPGLDAWCSFCCKPKSEVGPLVAGPTGVFVCRSCITLSTGLLGQGSDDDAPIARSHSRDLHTPNPTEADAPPPKSSRKGLSLVPPRASAPPAKAPPLEVPRGPLDVGTTSTLFEPLPHQRLAWHTLTVRGARLALVFGPPGSGKTTLLGALPDEVVCREVTAPMSEAEETLLLETPAAVVLSVPGDAPQPALVLEGSGGVESLYDTPSLLKACHGFLSEALLANVDAVAVLSDVGRDELLVLAQSLAKKRGVDVPAEVLVRLADMAQQSGRGARELTTLLSRIPPGIWTVRT